MAASWAGAGDSQARPVRAEDLGGGKEKDRLTRRRGDAELMALAEAQRRGDVLLAAKPPSNSNSADAATIRIASGFAAQTNLSAPLRLCERKTFLLSFFSAFPRLLVNPNPPA